MKLKYLVLIIVFLTSCNLSYSQFGKNKVQYEKFEWKFIESKHFDVYFHKGGEYLANYTALEAEKALLKIQSGLNYKLNTRISIVVFNSHNQFQQNNIISSFLSEGIGGVTQLYKNNIVIPFQGDYEQFQHVIFHELVHGVLNDMFHGGTLQSSMSNGGFFIPSWLNEGLSEYLSYEGMDAHTDMFMRDMAVSENLMPLNRLDGYTQYRAGQTFYWYVADKYGKEKVGDFINRLKIHKNVNAAFESTFKMSFEDFSEKWQKDVKKYFLPDLDLFKDVDDYAVPIAKRKKMKNFYNSAPAISPDGEKMAFISDNAGVLGISVMKIDDNKSIKNLISSFRKQDFEDLNILSPGISWNDKGTKIAISAKAGGEDAIFLVDAETGDYDKLVFGLKSIESVQWSPDGTMLAFSAQSDEKSDIYIYSFIKKKIENITNDLFSDLRPTWSLDSKSIYFISDRTDNLLMDKNKSNFKMWNYNPDNSDIYNISLNEKKIKRITFDPENKKSSISVSIDADKMLFVSDKNGISNVYELNNANSMIRPITNSMSQILQISLARDNSKLLFSVQNDGGYDIYMLRHPFDVKLENSELPLTKFRKSQKETSKLLLEIAKNEIDTLKSEKLQTYGDFQIDFKNQKLVEPNSDANSNKIEDESPNMDTNFIPKDYKLKFSPDVVVGNPGYSTYFGFQGVTQMQFSDELGDHQIFVQANLLYNLKNSSFFLAYNYLPNVVDYQINAFSGAGFINRPNEVNQSTLYRFRKIGMGGNASYPLNLFQRFDFGFSFLNLTKDNIYYPGTDDISKYLIVPTADYVYDDVLWGMYAPSKGTRMNFEITASPKLGENGSGFGIFKTDIRNYQYISNQFSFASRFSGGFSFGGNSRNFFLGGTENLFNPTFGSSNFRFGASGYLPFNDPEDFAFMQMAMPLRGFNIGELRGTKFFLTNFELRFPMLTALVAGPLPILIQGVMGSVFVDIGGAWNDKFTISETIIDEFGNERLQRNNLAMSAGLGIRSYLLGLPLKVDIAWRNEFYNWSPPVYLFSLGYDF
jgi:Tol biopolymer transport system component